MAPELPTAGEAHVGADVSMVRMQMDHLPVWPVPPGFRVRYYRDGDRQTWIDLQADEPLFTVTGQHFDETFGADSAALYDRLLFVETADGEPVGTAAGWWNDDWVGSGPWGQIHWVAVRQSFRGRGLSKPMVALALQRIAEAHGRTMLDTSTARPWAIKVYLDCGFVPYAGDLGDPDVVAAWQRLQSKLEHPALAQTLAVFNAP